MLIMYLLVELGNGKTRWNQVGVGIKNEDGSINVNIDLFRGATFQLKEIDTQEYRRESITS